MKLALFVGLGVAAALYIAALLSAVLRARTRGDSRVAPSRFELVLGFVACFFDTLSWPRPGSGTRHSMLDRPLID